jgi:hypothetical protein
VPIVASVSGLECSHDITMGKRPSKFKKLDVKRVLQACSAAGVAVKRVEIEHGKIVLIFGDTNTRQTFEPAALDVWRASRGAR